jgi:hypothetical protein
LKIKEILVIAQTWAGILARALSGVKIATIFECLRGTVFSTQFYTNQLTFTVFSWLIRGPPLVLGAV